MRESLIHQKNQLKELKAEVKNFSQIVQSIHSTVLLEFNSEFPKIGHWNKYTDFDLISKNASRHEGKIETKEMLLTAGYYPFEEEIKAISEEIPIEKNLRKI